MLVKITAEKPSKQANNHYLYLKKFSAGDCTDVCVQHPIRVRMATE